MIGCAAQASAAPCSAAPGLIEQLACCPEREAKDDPTVLRRRRPRAGGLEFWLDAGCESAVITLIAGAESPAAAFRPPIWDAASLPATREAAGGRGWEAAGCAGEAGDAHRCGVGCLPARF